MIAMDLTTGAKLWSKELPPSDCGASGDVRYSQSSTVVACLDLESGVISTFDAATGDALNTIDTSGIVNTKTPLASVHVQDDSLAVCERTSMSAVLRYGPAADFNSGWKIEIPANAPNGCTPTIAGSWVSATAESYIDDTHNPWLVIADLDGSTLFESFSTSGTLSSDGRIITQSDLDDYFAGYDILDVNGDLVATTGELGKFFSHPTEDAVFQYHVDPDGYVYRTEGNRMLWRYDETEDFSTIMPAANNLIFVEEKVRLSAYNVETGERRWSRALDQLVDANTPKRDVEDLFKRSFNGYSDGRYIVGSTENEMVAVDADTGDIAWSLPVQNEYTQRYGSYVFAHRKVDENSKEFPGGIIEVYRFERAN